MFSFPNDDQYGNPRILWDNTPDSYLEFTFLTDKRIQVRGYILYRGVRMKVDPYIDKISIPDSYTPAKLGVRSGYKWVVSRGFLWCVREHQQDKLGTESAQDYCSGGILGLINSLMLRFSTPQYYTDVVQVKNAFLRAALNERDSRLRSNQRKIAELQKEHARLFNELSSERDRLLPLEQEITDILNQLNDLGIIP